MDLFMDEFCYILVDELESSYQESHMVLIRLFDQHQNSSRVITVAKYLIICLVPPRLKDHQIKAVFLWNLQSSISF